MRWSTEKFCLLYGVRKVQKVENESLWTWRKSPIEESLFKETLYSNGLSLNEETLHGYLPDSWSRWLLIRTINAPTEILDLSVVSIFWSRSIVGHTKNDTAFVLDHQTNDSLNWHESPTTVVLSNRLCVHTMYPHNVSRYALYAMQVRKRSYYNLHPSLLHADANNVRFSNSDILISFCVARMSVKVAPLQGVFLAPAGVLS